MGKEEELTEEGLMETVNSIETGSPFEPEVLDEGKAENSKEKTEIKTPVLKTYYSIQKRRQLCIPCGFDKYKNNAPISKFFMIENHRGATSDPDIIKHLDSILEKQKNLVTSSKTIITQEEFDRVVTPDDTFISFKGQTMHITEVRDGLEYALNKGWKPEWRKVAVVKKRTEVQRGGRIAGQSKIPKV